MHGIHRESVAQRSQDERGEGLGLLVRGIGLVRCLWKLRSRVDEMASSTFPTQEVQEIDVDRLLLNSSMRHVSRRT